MHFFQNHLKSQKMCVEAVTKDLWSLEFVPDDRKSLEMCAEAVSREPWSLKCIPVYLKIEETCAGQCAKSHACYILFLMILRHWRCVSKQYAKQYGFFCCCYMIIKNRMFQLLQLFKRTTARNKIFLVGMTHNTKVEHKNLSERISTYILIF